MAERLATIADRQQRQNLAGCTEILAGLRFKKDLIRLFLREEMMQESVIYQDILLKGRQQGRQQEALAMVMCLLDLRWGEVEASLKEGIGGLSVEQLEALMERLFNVSDVEDLRAWLQQQQPQQRQE